MSGPFRTERLTLCPTGVADAAFIRELVNTPQWLRYIGDRQVYSDADATHYIREVMLPQFDRLGFGNYTVSLTANNTKIGTCGLYDRQGLPFPDLGFAFLPEYQGRGYAYEAARHLLDLIFTRLDYPEVLAITVPENRASQRLLERLDFTACGTVQLRPGEGELLRFSLRREKSTVGGTEG